MSTEGANEAQPTLSSNLVAPGGDEAPKEVRPPAQAANPTVDGSAKATPLESSTGAGDGASSRSRRPSAGLVHLGEVAAASFKTVLQHSADFTRLAKREKLPSSVLQKNPPPPGTTSAGHYHYFRRALLLAAPHPAWEGTRVPTKRRQAAALAKI